MSPQRQRGFSIVELLIAVALGLILTVGLISVFVSSKQGYRVQESRSRMQENARFALDYLSRSVRLADFWGSVPPNRITIYGATPYVGNIAASDCKDGWMIDPATGLRGYDGGASYPGDGLPASCFNDYVGNSDVIAIRYAEPDSVVATADLGSAASLANGKYFLRVLAGKSAGLFNAAVTANITSATTAIPDTVGSPGAVINYRMQSELYYLASPSGAVPSLYYTRNNIDGTGATALVDGIEMMQLEYGLDTNADLAADRYLAASAVGAANWAQVVSVRISLIIRGDTLDNFADVDPADAAQGRPYLMAGGYTYRPATAVQRFQRFPVVKEVQIRNRVKVR